MSQYSYETNGLKVVVKTVGDGKAPVIEYSRVDANNKTAITATEKTAANSVLVGKLGAAEGKLDPVLLTLLRDIAKSFKDEAAAKDALKKDTSMSDALDGSLLDAIKTQKISFGGGSTSKNDKVKIEKVGDDVTGDDVRIGTEKNKDVDPTAFIRDSASAEKIIEEFVKKPGGISMENALKGKALGQARDEVFTTQALSNLLHLVRGMQKNDGKYGAVSENSWDDITKKSHAEGGYKEDYEAFKKKYSIEGELNSNQAYAFMVYLIKNNQSARYNVGKNLFNISDQLLISSAAGNKQGVINPWDIQSMEVFGNVFDGLRLISRDLRYNQATLDYAKKLNGQLDGMGKWRWTNTDQEPTLLGGPQPQGLTNEVRPPVTPTGPKVLPGLCMDGEYFNPTDQSGRSRLGDREDPDKVLKRNYAAVLGDKDKVIFMDKDYRPVLLIRNGGTIEAYDLTKEHVKAEKGNDRKYQPLGLGELQLAEVNKAELRGVMVDIQKKGFVNNGEWMVFQGEIRKTRFEDPVGQILFRVHPETGEVEARLITRNLYNQNKAEIDKAISRSQSLLPLVTDKENVLHRLRPEFNKAAVITKKPEEPKQEVKQKDERPVLPSAPNLDKAFRDATDTLDEQKNIVKLTLGYSASLQEPDKSKIQDELNKLKTIVEGGKMLDETQLGRLQEISNMPDIKNKAKTLTATMGG